MKNKRLVRAAYTHNKGKWSVFGGPFCGFFALLFLQFFLRFWMWEIPSVRIVRMMSHNVDFQLVAIVASFLFVRCYLRGLWAGRFFGYVCDGGLTSGRVTAQGVDGIDLYLYFVTDGRSSELCSILFGDDSLGGSTGNRSHLPESVNVSALTDRQRSDPHYQHVVFFNVSLQSDFQFWIWKIYGFEVGGKYKARWPTIIKVYWPTFII